MIILLHGKTPRMKSTANRNQVKATTRRNNTEKQHTVTRGNTVPAANGAHMNGCIKRRQADEGKKETGVEAEDPGSKGERQEAGEKKRGKEEKTAKGKKGGRKKRKS